MKSTPILILFFLSTLVTAWPSQAQTTRPQQVRIALSTATPHNTPLWVAKDKKIFDKYGLDVQLIFVSGGTLVTQMLAAGEAKRSSTQAGLSILRMKDSLRRFTGANE